MKQAARQAWMIFSVYTVFAWNAVVTEGSSPAFDGAIAKESSEQKRARCSPRPAPQS